MTVALNCVVNPHLPGRIHSTMQKEKSNVRSTAKRALGVLAHTLNSEKKDTPDVWKLLGFVTKKVVNSSELTCHLKTLTSALCTCSGPCSFGRRNPSIPNSSFQDTWQFSPTCMYVNHIHMCMQGYTHTHSTRLEACCWVLRIIMSFLNHKPG